MAEEKTFFQILTSTVDKKFFPTETQIETLNSYIMLQYISNDPMGAIVANSMNVYHNTPITAQYRFIRHALPKNVKFIKFLKKEKVSDENINLISKYYNLNDKLAMEYLEMMTEEDILRIKDYYSGGRM
jgi:hypothetical protein